MPYNNYMKQTKKFSTILFTLSIFLFFVSCGNMQINGIASKAKPVSTAKAVPGLNPEIKRMLELAQQVEAFAAKEYGIVNPAKEMRYLSGSRAHLAWRLVIAEKQSVKPFSVTFFTDEAKAKLAEADATKQNKFANLQPVEFLRSISDKPSPLLESFVSWPYEKIVEWVNLQLFESACASAKNAKDLEGFSVFASEQASIEFMRKQLPPDSPVLGRYMSGKRDERTFAALFPDFKSRFETLYAQKPLPADVEKRRDFLASTWIADYRSTYSNRFITNLYADFGKAMPSDVEIAAWENKYKNWNKWEALFRANGEKLVAMIPVVIKIK